jgi:hypothetical protein
VIRPQSGSRAFLDSKFHAPHRVAAHVPEGAAIARLSVAVGGGSSMATRASVSLFFGRTELTADAHSKTTGDRRKVQIDWNAAATLRAPGESGVAAS